MENNNDKLREKIDLVDINREKIKRKYINANITQHCKNEFYIRSVLFENSVYGNINNLTKGIFVSSSYDNLPLSFFAFPFYINIHYSNALDTELIIDMINKEKISDVPIVVINPKSLINNDNVLYRFTAKVSLDDIYNVVINDQLYLYKKDQPLVRIKSFDSDTLTKVITIKNYIEKKFPYRKITYGISINKFEDLEKIKEFYNILGNDLVIYLNKDAFFYDNVDGLSFRKLLYDDKLLNEFSFNIKIFYIRSSYNNFKEIVELEKAIDVIVSRIPKNAFELDKITFVTLFLINYLEYDNDIDKVRNLFELLKEQLGVCREFSEIANAIFKRVGLESKCIYAMPIVEEEEGHVFNVVTINNKKYYLDITFLLDEIKSKYISSIEDSNNFLTDGKHFDKDHKNILKYVDYHCEYMDRDEIKRSIKRVVNWQNKYHINFYALKDLFRKHQLLIDKNVIIDALPSKRGGR